jgi:hypothetical protein
MADLLRALPLAIYMKVDIMFEIVEVRPPLIFFAMVHPPGRDKGPGSIGSLAPYETSLHSHEMGKQTMPHVTSRSIDPDGFLSIPSMRL